MWFLLPLIAGIIGCAAFIGILSLAALAGGIDVVAVFTCLLVSAFPIACVTAFLTRLLGILRAGCSAVIFAAPFLLIGFRYREQTWYTSGAVVLVVSLVFSIFFAVLANASQENRKDG